jgi:hypothetical protein
MSKRTVRECTRKHAAAVPPEQGAAGTKFTEEAA